MNVINEDQFIRAMKKRWRSEDYENNFVTKPLIKAWKTILSAFNDQLAGKEGLLTCDAVCGTGKTTSLEQACGILAKHHPDVGVLIVVRLRDQCDKVMENINEAAGRKCAVSVHTGGKKMDRNRPSIHEKWEWSKEGKERIRREIANSQIVVITHKAYLAAVSASTDRTSFKRWKHGERKLRVCDEALDLVERHHISTSELLQLKFAIESHTKYFGDIRHNFADELELLFTVIERVSELNETDLNWSHNLFDDVLVKMKKPVYLSALIPTFERSPISSWQTLVVPRGMDKEVYWDEWKSGMVQRISVFDRIVRYRMYVSNEFRDDDGNKHKTLSRGTFLLPENFESLVVLDATSNVDKMYQYLGTGNVHPYRVPKEVRLFHNATLHFRPDKSGLGKGETLKTLERRIPEILKWAKESFTTEDKILFAGHKKLMASLQMVIEQKDFDFVDKEVKDNGDVELKNVSFAHYGIIDGRNDWKDYTKLVILSLPYLPNFYSPCAKQAALQVNPNVVLDDRDDIASSNMAVQIIQLICRIIIRTVSDKQGNCPPCDIFMLLHGDDPMRGPEGELKTNYESLLHGVSPYILREIQENLNGIQTAQWESFSGFQTKQGKSIPRRGVSESFIAWLTKLEPGETRSKSDFIEEMQLDKKQQASLAVSLSPPKETDKRKKKSPALRAVGALGIQMKSKPGKGTFFTKPLEE